MTSPAANPSPPKPRKPVRQRLLSSAQAGWALTLVTVVSLGVGVVVVGGLGGGQSAPPLEIEALDSTPSVAPGPTFQILEQDEPAAEGVFPAAFHSQDGTPNSAEQARWAESFLPASPTGQRRR